MELLQLAPDVIAKYAGTVAVECFGIVGMAAVNMKDGFVQPSQERESDTWYSGYYFRR